MQEENRTLVLVALDMTLTPVAPHRPGTFVVGYVDGDQKEANDYLNQCKKDQINGTVQNAWLIQTGIEFEPIYDRPPIPGQPPPRVTHMDIKQGFACFPLTKLDALNGSDFSLPLSYWVFPKGTMIQDIGAEIDKARENMATKRSGVTVHSAGLPPGLKPPGPH